MSPLTLFAHMLILVESDAAEQTYAA